MEFNGEQEGILDEKKFVEVQKLLDAKKDKPRRGDQSQQVTLLLGLLRCGFCGCAYTASFVNKKMKAGTKTRYYYYKCTTKSRADAEACCGTDLKSEMIDDAVVEFIHDFSKKPKLLKSVIEASAEATRIGVSELEKDRSKLTKELSKLEKDSMTLVDRLAAPSTSGISAIKIRLSKLESEQQNLKSKITDLTLQIRDRRDLDISTEEVLVAYKDFAGLWEKLEFDER